MKRYLLFSGRDYSSGNGGVWDLVTSSNDEAKLKRSIDEAVVVPHKEIPEHQRLRGHEMSTSPSFVRKDPNELITIPAVPAWKEYRRDCDWAHVLDTKTGLVSHASFTNRTKRATWSEWAKP